MYDEHETCHRYVSKKCFKDHNVEKDAGVMVQLCIASTTMVPAPVLTHAHCSTCSREASQLSRLSEGPLWLANAVVRACKWLFTARNQCGLWAPHESFFFFRQNRVIAGA